MVGLVFLTAPVLSCFSERAALTGPIDGECEFAVDDELLGENRTLVAIIGFEFVPEEVHVSPGTTVTWVNCEPAGTDRHTATSDQGVWGSDLMGRGENYSYTFDEVGDFPYHCVPHPFMTGRVIVEE